MTNDQAGGDGLKKSLTSAATKIVVALVLQTGAFLFWAGGINARVDRVEVDVQSLNACIHHIKTTALTKVP